MTHHLDEFTFQVRVVPVKELDVEAGGLDAHFPARWIIITAHHGARRGEARLLFEGFPDSCAGAEEFTAWLPDELESLKIEACADLASRPALASR